MRGSHGPYAAPDQASRQGPQNARRLPPPLVEEPRLPLLFPFLAPASTERPPEHQQPEQADVEDGHQRLPRDPVAQRVEHEQHRVTRRQHKCRDVEHRPKQSYGLYRLYLHVRYWRLVCSHSMQTLRPRAVLAFYQYWDVGDAHR